MDYICQAISQLYNLHNLTINLSYNRSISNDTLLYLSKAVGQLPRLRKLSLNMGQTETSNYGFDNLFLALKRCERIKILKIWFSPKANDSTYLSLSKLLVDLKYLRSLKINGNKIEVTGLNALHQGLMKTRLNNLNVEFYDP